MRRSLVALALAVTLPLPVLAGQVTVKEGETLSEIAERHGVSVSRLMQINGLRDADQLQTGQTLTIPGSGGAKSVPSGRSAAGTITVQEGETLSEIAERHGVSVSRLMQTNGLSNADALQVGQTLRLPGAGSASPRSTGSPVASAASYPRGASEHVVRSGESLSGIADGYGIGLSKLIAINGISDPDHVEAGTRLKLKGTPVAPAPRPAVPKAAVTTATANAGSSRPPVRPQTVTPAAARPVGTATPVSRPAVVAAAPATRQAATANTPATTVAMAQPDWRTYGPLQVNWAGWQPMGGSMVAPTLNRQGQTLYVAINCGARKFNTTTPSGEWLNWSDPSGDDERQLISDYCRSRS